MNRSLHSAGYEVPTVWGIAKSVKARDFDSRIVGSSPATPASGSLAQLVEHLTFNQGVPGSNPGRATIKAPSSSG